MLCLQHQQSWECLEDGAGQVWPECPWVGVAVLLLRGQLTPRGHGSAVSEVDMEELNDFGHELPRITQQCLEVVRSPSVFVSPFCCS